MIVCTAVVLASCAREVGRYTASFLTLFDTVTTVTGYAKDRDEFAEFAEKVRGELEKYHRMYDIYHEYEGMNNLRTVNLNAGVAPVEVCSEIIDLLEFSVRMYDLTDGAVNVAMGSVLSVWHDFRETGDSEDVSLPTKGELETASRHTDISKISIDREKMTVYLRDPEMSLDVGAVAKGYACERVCLALRDESPGGFVLNVGGNVRVCVSGSDDKWNVGVRNPDKTSDTECLCTLGLRDAALVCSGTYERYRTADGTAYHHIIDPETLMPGTRYSQVAVAACDSGLADALSTALFNTDLDAGMRLVADMPGVEAMWVASDGREYFSDGFLSFEGAS